ncbi:MAG: hypothetical protein HY720_25760 [Planctomycetes bacterium]|nr:hypothetical protein [Planctomycetota bacterium]
MPRTPGAALVLALLYLAGAPPAAAQDGEGPALPTAWQGEWEGTCRLAAPGGGARDFAMELRVAPVEGAAAWTWTMVYGEGEEKEVRDYRLVAAPSERGRFVLDEENGIRIDMALVGEVLYGEFEVGSSRIASRFERRGESLLVEMASYAIPEPRVTQDEGGANTVRSFRLASVQSGSLTRGASGGE